MKKLTIFVLLMYAPVIVFAQANLGSWEKQVHDWKNDLNKAITVEEIANFSLKIAGAYLSTSPDSVIKYATISLNESRKYSYLRGEIGALGFIGEAEIYNGNLPRTLELALQAIELAKGHNGTEVFIGPTLYNMSELYTQIGDYEKAITYSKEQINSSDNVTKAYGYFELANTFEKMNKPDSALKNLDLCYQTFTKAKNEAFADKYDVYPTWYNIRANVNFQLNKSQEGLNDLLTGLAMTEESQERYHIANFSNALSLYYKQSNLADSSFFYAQKGLIAASEITYIQGILEASKLLADFFEGKDASKALHYYKLASENQNKLYGAGNMQIIREMISKEESRVLAMEEAQENYESQLRQYILLAGLFFVLVVAFILYRNNKKNIASNVVLNNTLSNLKSTQSQLIQSEKMASLGELTAGIAHEIQNPLNFVNNFSEVSGELVEEANEELDKGEIVETKEILNDLKQNLDKINHHGNRASSIVKGMLEHSQTSSGEKIPTDINALADEYLRLSYHGLRAKDKDFQSDFKTVFDENLTKVNIIPQDMGRVLLNLINNSFQAVTERSRSVAKEDNHQPLVTISTRLTANSQVLIAIKDNGSGIPESIKDKIFQPFFTTKPTGKGTGLGLSLAYDIVSAHGGELTLESKEGGGATFIIKLPMD